MECGRDFRVWKGRTVDGRWWWRFEDPDGTHRSADGFANEELADATLCATLREVCGCNVAPRDPISDRRSRVAMAREAARLRAEVDPWRDRTEAWDDAAARAGASTPNGLLEIVFGHGALAHAARDYLAELDAAAGAPPEHRHLLEPRVDAARGELRRALRALVGVGADPLQDAPPGEEEDGP
jgi:hypothetical protein